MRFKSWKLKLTTLSIFASIAGQSQAVLDDYVHEGLVNNIVLKEKKVALEKSLVSLKEAKSLFLPTSNFDASYTIADGGRSIDIPVGDLMNPVYKTLNQLTASEKFPSISNASEQLNPNNFYDVRIKTSMPLINTDVRYNRNIKSEQVKLQQSEIDIYKRELIKEIKSAYYNFLMTAEAISIFENAISVVRQNVKVNQSLLANGKGLPAYVSRSESELQKVESQLQTAKNEHENARAYFNFLLNESLTRPVIKDASVKPDSMIAAVIDNGDNIEKREELQQLKIASNINENAIKMNQAFRTPKLNAFVDLGSQGYNFKFNQQSLFYLGGLQMTVPIFHGKRNLYKIEQSKFDQQNLQLQTENTRQQLQLSAHVARNNVLSAYHNYQASEKQYDAARQYFKLIDRGYNEGVNSFIEFLDARNQLTTSQLQVTINKFKLASSLADYERQTSAYIIK